MASKSRRLRQSKLDAHSDIVGVLTDKEVAARADVTPESVRTYRLRRSIPAEWRGETRADLDGRKVRGIERGTRRRKLPVPRLRTSKLDPFAHLLGDVPDRQLGEMAGVSAENVRSYRSRRGVPARWRGEDSSADPQPTADLPALEATDRVRLAWRIVVEVDGQSRDYVGLGHDVVSATAAAAPRLEALHPGARIREVALLGEAI